VKQEDERAREVISEWLNHDLTSWIDTELAELRELIAAALTAARAQGRAEVRATAVQYFKNVLRALPAD